MAGGCTFAAGRLDANNGHADFFTRNLTAIRAEVRAALIVWRPAAFGLVTGLAPVTLEASAGLVPAQATRS